MTLEEYRKLSPGLYRLHWKSGGSSLAAIGVTANGSRWIAPTNWICADNDPETNKYTAKIWEEIAIPSPLILNEDIE